MRLETKAVILLHSKHGQDSSKQHKVVSIKLLMILCRKLLSPDLYNQILTKIRHDLTEKIIELFFK